LCTRFTGPRRSSSTRSKAGAAFTDPESAFAEIEVKRRLYQPYHRIEVMRMRAVSTSQMILPLTIVLLGALLLMGRLDMIQLSRYQEFWPVALIAAGLEELYMWTRSGHKQ
jgi:hypothetical protein